MRCCSLNRNKLSRLRTCLKWSEIGLKLENSFRVLIGGLMKSIYKKYLLFLSLLFSVVDFRQGKNSTEFLS
jgi:hypothetical protein